jgi:nitrogen fixation protein FixH
MKWRMHPWPLGILGALVVFFLGMVTLVVMASRSGMELVSPDYYEDTIVYEGRMEALRLTAPLAGEITATYDAGTRTIRWQIPEDHAQKGATGAVVLYRPSGAGEDRKVPLQADGLGRQVLSAEGMSSGLWRVQSDWEVAGTAYHAEREVVVTVSDGGGN